MQAWIYVSADIIGKCGGGREKTGFVKARLNPTWHPLKGHFMKTTHLLLAAICAATVPTAYAIQPEYEGGNGVLANVFQTNCLFCHSSNLSGAARNGAPVGFNWDVYEAVVTNFDRIVVRAVIEQSMPPGFSGIPKLNQEQKDALLAWQAAGFPQAPQQVSTIKPQYEGEFGIFDEVFAVNCIACHSSTKTGAARHGAPEGFNWDVYASAAAHGERIIERAVRLKTMPPASSGIPTLDQEQQDAMLAWQAAGFPATAAENVSDASFDYISQELTLPVVIVGEQTYEAKLRLVAMAASPIGLGFELFSATPTNASSAKAVTYSPATGEVTIPEVVLLNGTGTLPSNRVSAQMVLVPNNSPFSQFAVTGLSYLAP
jgi:mono/diheme cytochrome c family protein